MSAVCSNQAKRNVDPIMILIRVVTANWQRSFRDLFVNDVLESMTAAAIVMKIHFAYLKLAKDDSNPGLWFKVVLAVCMQTNQMLLTCFVIT